MEAPLSKRFTLILFLSAALFGALIIAARRHEMSWDGIQYVEMAREAPRSAGGSLISSYWSPAYPAILAVVFAFLDPSLEGEVYAVHGVGLFLYLFALGALWLLIRERLLASPPGQGESDGRINRAWAAAAVALFVFAAVWSTAIFRVTPDMLVCAAIFLAAAAVFRIDRDPRRTSSFALLGLSLGLGYWAKTSMLPLGIALSTILFLTKRAQ